LWHENTTEPSILIELDHSRAREVERRLQGYKLRASVSVADASNQVHAIYSNQAFGGDTPDPRMPNLALGWRDFAPFPIEQFSFEDGAAVFEALRIERGVPDLARDAAAEEVFAGEALLDELNGVDFQKGCFVGQENVSRMKRRATTRRKFCPIVFEGAPLPFGAAIKAGESELGSVRSGAEGRAIALLRLDRALEAVERGAALTVEERAVRLDPPPWLILPQREAE
jgi:folate-binding protein YgfZ